MPLQDFSIGLVPARFRAAPGGPARRRAREQAAPDDGPAAPVASGCPEAASELSPALPSTEPEPIDWAAQARPSAPPPADAEGARAGRNGAAAKMRWRDCPDAICRRRRRCAGRCRDTSGDAEAMAYLYKLLKWRAGEGPEPERPGTMAAPEAPVPSGPPRRKRPSVRRRC